LFIVGLFISIKHFPEQPLNIVDPFKDDSIPDEDSEFIAPILPEDLIDPFRHELFDQSAGLDTAGQLEESAELPPEELATPGPAHGDPLLLEMCSDSSLDANRCLHY
jgi:hypothetical protein